MITTNAIAEIQGMYGPVSIPETLIQKIWLRGEFVKNGLQTVEGAPLIVVKPGRWNPAEGPDFLDTEVIINGEHIGGDAEVHFYVRDWCSHGHQSNPAFDNVVLHVLLFAPGVDERPAETLAGSCPQAVALLPFLARDLEEYADDEALLALEKRDVLDLAAPFLEMPENDRRALLRRKGLERWRRKVDFARKRLAAADWPQACHRFCLEGLGLRRNREVMTQLAKRFPHVEMVRNPLPASGYFNAFRDDWKLAATRPANHPRLRLKQYRELLAADADWAQGLAGWAHRLPEQAPEAVDRPSAEFRANEKLPSVRRDLQEGVFHGKIGGTRFDTLVCDAFIPLAAVAAGKNLAAWWFHWPCGDAPDALRRFLKTAGITNRKHPFSNGFAQGALQVFIEEGLR